MTKTILAIAITLSMTTAFAGNNKYGAGNSSAVAGAINSNRIGVGVGVRSTNRNTNVNSLGVSNHNANVGINGQSQTNRNTNLNSDYNSNTNKAYGGHASSLAFGGSAKQGQDQAQRQSQNQLQGNHQVLQYNESNGLHYSGEYSVENTPSVNAIAPPSTAPCYVGVGASVNLPGFGGGLSGGIYDKECEIRETVRIGLMGDALTKNLANQVLQNKLLGYLEEEDETTQARLEIASEVETANVFDLTNY